MTVSREDARGAARNRDGLKARNAWDARVIALGGRVAGVFGNLAAFARFAIGLAAALPAALRRPAAVREQLVIIGTSSLPLVAFISVFSGAVAAWQAAYNFADYIPLRYVGSAVGKSVMLELGPVLTAIVVAGRAGAAMAAELGTMTVTEQIDAMKALGLNPRRLLLAPRLLAAVIALPLLTVFSSIIALSGALAVVALFRDMPPETFLFGVRLFYSDRDVIVGLVKAAVFGGWIALFGCWFGMAGGRGAEGVGRAVTSAVVWADIAILVNGFVLSKLLLT